MAHNDPRPQHIYQDEEDDYPPANEAVSGEYGYPGEDGEEDGEEDDLPANFAREAARNQSYQDEHFGDGASDVDPPVGGSRGRGGEADDITQPGSGSNPFADDGSQGVGVSAGGYADTDDRPIMGYNPFLNDDRSGGHDGVGAGDAHFDGSRENDQFYQERDDDDHYGADQGEGHHREEARDAFDSEQQRGITPGYNRLEEEEDEADLEMDPVENVRREDDDVYQRPEAVGCHLYGDGERQERGLEEDDDREEEPVDEPHGEGSDRLGGQKEFEEEDDQRHEYKRGHVEDDYQRPEAVGCTLYRDDGPSEEDARDVDHSEEVDKSFEENFEKPVAVKCQLFGPPEDENLEKPVAVKCQLFGPPVEEKEDEGFQGEASDGLSHEEEDRGHLEAEDEFEHQDHINSGRPLDTGFETRESDQFDEYQGQPSGEVGNADSQDEQEYDEGVQSEEPAPQGAKETEEDLGIVNQAFSDDADVEERRVIDEEEEEFEDRKPVEGIKDEEYDREEAVDQKDDEREEINYDEHAGEIEEDKMASMASYAAATNDSAPNADQRDFEEDEEEEDAVTEKYKDESRLDGELEENEERETENISNKEREATEEFDRFSKGDDSRDNLSEEEDEIRKEQLDAYDRGLESRFQDSDTISSQQEDRSFVDNLSELTSPDTIPQPLPSPPEPRETMSPFDPTAPSDSPSPCHENLGQHSEFTQHAGTVDNTGDFLTAGEVEGETKFGVDGTAITSTTERNGTFLNSEEDDEEDETEEESQQLDQGCVTATGTTETETSVDDKSGEYGGHGFEPMENNALMSMSMEGSFYDDGGELIGGEDRRGQENQLYQEEENYEQHNLELNQHIQNGFSHDKFQQPGHDAFGVHEDKDQSAFDPLHDTSDPPQSSGGGVDSLLDAPFTAQGLQTPVTEQSSTVDSSVDNTGIDSIAGDYHSSVDAAPPAGEPEESEQEVPGESNIDAVGITSPPEEASENHKDLEEALGSVQISEPVSEKAEEPSSSVDEPPPAPKAEDALAAASAPAAAGVVAAAAAAAGVATAKTTTTVKKSTTAKVGGKTTTTTTTKVVKETKTTNGRPASTKKTEVTTTVAATTKATTAATTKAAPKKPDSRPTSVTTTERKTPAKTTATSPTKSASPAAPKPSGPVPSYAQPITPRKPREAKPASPEEKKKTPTPRTPSATARTPRTTSTATTATTTTSSAVSSTITKTTVRTTSATAASVGTRTAQLARPKSSPTKLSNGTAGAPSTATDNNKSPTKKSTDVKPGSGSLKITHEKKEVKITSRIDSGTKTAPTTAALKSPTKPASPRVPSATSTPKSGEVKSKVGSLDKTNHTPGGGNVKIQHKKTEYANVTSKIGSKDKIDHKPGGGNVKIETKKLKIEAKSKIGSLENASHKPAGGDKKIESKKLDWKVESKIGSLENAKHVAGGGDKKIETKKLEWNAKPKIGSLDNATHVPAGGDKKIEVQKTEWKAQSKVGSLDNAKHKPGGGDKQIESRKLDFKEKASPKIGLTEQKRLSSNGIAEGAATEVPATNGATSDN